MQLITILTTIISTKLYLCLSLVDHSHNNKNGSKIKIKANIIIINLNPLVKILSFNCFTRKEISCVL